MKKRKVGILTFSDGRKYIHEDLLAVNQRYEERLVQALDATGEVEAIAGEEIVWTPELAQREGRRLAAAGAELTIFNFAIWTFPHLTAVATRFAPGPYLLFCNLHPSEPGMVAMLANAGMLDQLGLPYARVWGDIEDQGVLQRVMSFIRGASALYRLKGQTYGLFGGRPLGMFTAVSDLDQWMSVFGVDVEHIEQYDIVMRSDGIENGRVEAAFQWLTRHIGSIPYDGKMPSRGCAIMSTDRSMPPPAPSGAATALLAALGMAGSPRARGAALCASRRHRALSGARQCRHDAACASGTCTPVPVRQAKRPCAGAPTPGGARSRHPRRDAVVGCTRRRREPGAAGRNVGRSVKNRKGLPLMDSINRTLVFSFLTSLLGAAVSAQEATVGLDRTVLPIQLPPRPTKGITSKANSNHSGY